MSQTIPVTVCDDSKLARKQIARSLENWAVDITFAENGSVALNAIAQDKAHLLFLDLNMPVMDGYQVLEMVRANDLPTLIIVVSGDIQPEARKRVMELGALEFIQKPVDNLVISEVLRKYGLLHELQPGQPTIAQQEAGDTSIGLTDFYQELANISMGQAADLLAKQLNTFINMPIPRVSMISLDEIKMALNYADDRCVRSTICQGFVGSRIAGEALMLFSDACFEDVAKLMQYQGEITDVMQRELLMDMGNALMGAFLSNFSSQIDVSFSHGPPVILLHENSATRAIQDGRHHADQTMIIEINYTIPDHNVTCDLLILFTHDSLQELNDRAGLLA